MYTVTERADQLHHDNVPAHSTALVQDFLAKHHINQVCQPLPPYSPDLAPYDFWLFPKLNSPLKARRFVNATVTHYTSSVNGVSLPTDKPHGRVAVHGCTVRSPLTGCQVSSRPRDRFSRYSKWLNTFRTALVLTLQMWKSRGYDKANAYAFFLLPVFRRVRKTVKKRLLVSSYLSIRLSVSWNNSAVTGGISRNWIFDYFSKICQECSWIVKLWQ